MKNYIPAQNINWESEFHFPSPQEIQNYNRKSKVRSPCIYGWLRIPNYTKYTEYMIDFKSDHLPKGTYCCLANWSMDYSYLEKQYNMTPEKQEHISAYAGFQSVDNAERRSLMSFWDVFCRDLLNKRYYIRAKRIFPTFTNFSEDFSGEGTGAHCFVAYPWKEKQWYRMHLKCKTSAKTGNTIVEQWVMDLETGANTLLCCYDTGIQHAKFQGSIAIFLENFLTEHAGEVRSLQVCNAKYFSAATKKWIPLTEIYMGSDSGLPKYEGSYNYGVKDNSFWMITSGVGGDYFNNGKGKKPGTYFIL